MATANAAGMVGDSAMLQISSSQRTSRWILIAIALAVVVWFFFSAGAALFPFGLGLVLAYILLPVVNRLEATLPWPKSPSARRSVAILLVYAVVAIVVGLTLAYLVPSLIGEVGHFVELLPTYVESAQS